jgi:hypothetical protein
VLELFIVLPYIIHGTLSPLSVQRALGLILGGPFTFAFWVLFMALGLLLPLALELWEMRPVLLEKATLHPRRLAPRRRLVLLAALRWYVFVYAGQMSSFE